MQSSIMHGVMWRLLWFKLRRVRAVLMLMLECAGYSFGRWRVQAVGCRNAWTMLGLLNYEQSDHHD